MHPFVATLAIMVFVSCGLFVGVAEFLRTFKIWRKL